MKQEEKKHMVSYANQNHRSARVLCCVCTGGGPTACPLTVLGLLLRDRCAEVGPHSGRFEQKWAGAVAAAVPAGGCGGCGRKLRRCGPVLRILQQQSSWKITSGSLLLLSCGQASRGAHRLRLGAGGTVTTE